jgi:HD-GYP domain-containing protein (c-di-GMP phosphodiesterase class II)
MSISLKGCAEPWDYLDGFVRDLQGCPDTAGQVRLALDTVHKALRADLVCWCPVAGGEAVVATGTARVSPEWCRTLARGQLDRKAEGCSQVLQPTRGVLADDPGPASVAMVCISRTRAIWLVALRWDVSRPFRTADVRLMALVRRLLVAQRRHARAQEKLKGALLGLVRSLATAINAKSPYTSEHSERVARIAVVLGRHMGLSAAMLGNLYLGGLLHDIGKIGVQSNVLQKPGRLSESEYAHVREHPAIGDAVIAPVLELAHLRPGVRHHHERFDGAGYPDGLAGRAIPLLARILAVADACDAMASPRAYRPALPAEKVDEVLTAGAGTQWDPEVIAHYLACREDVYAICATGLGDSVLAAVAEVVKAGECADADEVAQR